MRPPTAASAGTIASVLVAAGLAACADGTGPEADLTREQAEKVAQAGLSERLPAGFRQHRDKTPSVGPAASSLSLSQQVSRDTTIEFQTAGEGFC